MKHSVLIEVEHFEAHAGFFASHNGNNDYLYHVIELCLNSCNTDAKQHFVSITSNGKMEEISVL